MIIRFTIPAKYASDGVIHPVEPSITPSDWFEVQADTEAQARRYVNETFGDHVWCSTYTDSREDEKEWVEDGQYHYGECKAFIDLWKKEADD